MAVRPIDGEALWDKLEDALWYDNCDRDMAEKIVLDMHTLTPPNEWVSVEDAVPDPGVRVLAANGNFVGEAYMASNGAWMRHDGFPWKADAWIPLPEPPDRRPPEGEEAP